MRPFGWLMWLGLAPLGCGVAYAPEADPSRPPPAVLEPGAELPPDRVLDPVPPNELARAAESRLDASYLATFEAGRPDVGAAAAQMTSLVALFEATDEPRFLDRLVAEADRMLATRDDRQGRRDGIRRRTLAGWSSTMRCAGVDERLAHAWYSGLIFRPLLRFAEVVRERHLEAYAAKERTYVNEARQSLAAFASEFQSLDAGGAYVYPAGIGRCSRGYAAREGHPLPLASVAALGSAETLLVGLRADPQLVHVAHVGQLARYAASSLRRVGPAFVWGTHIENPDVVDDTNRAGNVATFVADARIRGLGFSDSHVAGLLGTLRLFSFDAGGVTTFSEKIDGSGEKSTALNGRCGRWLELAPLARGAWETCASPQTDNVLHLAQLARLKRILPP